MTMRDTYKYVLKRGEVIIYRDVTNDLVRRAQEHKTRYPDCNIVQVGRKTTRAAGLKWKQSYKRR